MKTVLLVEPCDGRRAATRWLLNSFGYVVDTVEGPIDALAIFDPKTHDLVIIDNAIQEITGPELSHIIKMRSARTPVLMCTDRQPDDRTCVDALIIQPHHVLAVVETAALLLLDQPPRLAGEDPPASAQPTRTTARTPVPPL